MATATVTATATEAVAATLPATEAAIAATVAIMAAMAATVAMVTKVAMTAAMVAMLLIALVSVFKVVTMMASMVSAYMKAMVASDLDPSTRFQSLNHANTDLVTRAKTMVSGRNLTLSNKRTSNK